MSRLLEVDQLSKSFGGLHVTQAVSFHLDQGDRVALIGPNGAGKTTLVNLLSGQLAPSSGRIVYQGQDIAHLPIAARARLGLIRTFQITRLFGSLTAAQNLTLAIMQRQRLTRQIFTSATANAQVNEELNGILEMLGIAHLSHLPVADLAYGQQRLLEMAMGLALKPKVLLLDEPAAGVPHDEAPKILDAIARLPADIAVLMIEHDMDLIFRFAKRVLVLDSGRLIFEGDPMQVTRDDQVRRAYLGSYANARRDA